jgi:multiple sugar transport system ATP-binding protein
MARIELRQVCKTLKGGGKAAFSGSSFLDPRDLAGPAKGPGFSIEGLDLEIPDGEVMAVLGPSGCGKSTLLRLIAGLMPVDSGSILYDGADAGSLPPGERGIGMVFQNYALYPHMDSRANVLSRYLFRKRTTELDAEAAAKYRRTAELLGVEIEKLMDRMPKGLSGGEQQRVAVARCITRDPKLFLLDEPFSNLDQKLRERYRSQLRILLKQFSITTVYVTHDQVEALVLADLIAIMNQGRIEQVGTAQQIYDEPATAFAADFINFEPDSPPINFIDGSLVSAELSRFTIGARPEDIEVAGPGEAAEGLRLRGRLVDLRPMPLRKMSVLCVRVAESDIYLRVPEGAAYGQGSTLELSLPAYHLFDKESGRRVESRKA